MLLPILLLLSSVNWNEIEKYRMHYKKAAKVKNERKTERKKKAGKMGCDKKKLWKKRKYYFVKLWSGGQGTKNTLPTTSWVSTNFII